MIQVPCGLVTCAEQLSSSPSLAAECVDDAIRLVDSSGAPTQDSGVVEVCLSGRWSRVCHETWDVREAEVICQQLGHSSSTPG